MTTAARRNTCGTKDREFPGGCTPGRRACNRTCRNYLGTERFGEPDDRVEAHTERCRLSLRVGLAEMPLVKADASGGGLRVADVSVFLLGDVVDLPCLG